MKIIKYPAREDWPSLLRRPEMDVRALFDKVQSIIDRVRSEGDRAVLEYEEAFDKVKLTSLQVTEEEIEEAEKQVPIELKAAIMLAQRNITTFHERQAYEGFSVETMEGLPAGARQSRLKR